MHLGMSGRFDITSHFPTQFIDQAKKSPMLNVEEANPNFQLMYFGFKADRPLVRDKRVREAMSIGINRAELVKGVMLGQAAPAYTYIHDGALDFNPATATVCPMPIPRLLLVLSLLACVRLSAANPAFDTYQPMFREAGKKGV